MNIPVLVKEIYQINEVTLGITWTDQRKSELDVIMLRERCPCADCKEKKFTSGVFASVRPIAISSMGRYALSIAFSDGHKTGIYTFDMLRTLPLPS